MMIPYTADKSFPLAAPITPATIAGLEILVGQHARGASGEFERLGSGHPAQCNRSDVEGLARE